MNSRPLKTLADLFAAFTFALSFWLFVSGCADRQIQTGAGTATGLSERLTFYSVPFR